jgi:hypothetical protein
VTTNQIKLKWEGGFAIITCRSHQQRSARFENSTESVNAQALLRCGRERYTGYIYQKKTKLKSESDFVTGVQVVS